MRPYKFLAVFHFSVGLLLSEVHTLTLRQALLIAAQQSPDIVLARLDKQHADEEVDIARDPFAPKMVVRSDAVYTSGYPNNIYGHSPSVIGGEVDMTLFDRARRYQLAATRQQAKSYLYSSRSKADEVAFQIASLYLDARESASLATALGAQVSPLEKVVTVTENQLTEGSVLPVDLKRARVSLAEVEQRLEAARADETQPETLLAVALGFPGSDVVCPAGSEEHFARPAFKSESALVDAALANSKDLLQLEASMLAKRIELKSYEKTRLPQVNLVAQYSLIQKNTYSGYFASQSIQRNNGELGADFILPLLVGSAPEGRHKQAEIDLAKLQLQVDQLRQRIIANTHRSLQQLQESQGSLDIARQQLDLARDELAVTLSLVSGGRSGVSESERARASVNEHEISVAQNRLQVNKAELGVLRQLGNLMSVLTADTANAIEPSSR